MNYRKSVGMEIKVLSNLLKRKIHTILPKQEAELTDSERQVVRFLHNNMDSEIFQKDIEDRFVIRRSTASRMLKALEKKDIIVRESVSRDARLKKISLTPMAKAMQDTVISRLDVFEEIVRTGISKEEIEVFFSVTEKIKKNLEDEQ